MGLTVQSALGGGSGGGVGVGQTWQNVAGSRAVDTSYQNTTGKPIVAMITITGTSDRVQVSSDNSTWINVASKDDMTSAVVLPNNYYYRVLSSGTAAVINSWVELR